ncbi:type VI secretion system Vgr family protein [Variovorax sp. dw_954]|uniref:type VI secretion system Vgr family protein n=1 Tax=unclassified Variovorax TaxID=663243 RepID=UPI001BD63733
MPEAAKVANDSIVVERFTGLESVNSLFDFTVDVLATSGVFDPVQLIGEEVTLRLLLADGSTRAWHGQLIGVDALGGDGGVERYRFHLQPWLAQLGLRRDSFVYANKSVREIVSEVFADYPVANFSFSVLRELPVLPTCTQYRESDLAFVRRLLAQASLSFRFEHEQTERSSSSTEVSPSRHRLVIFDAHAKLPDCPLSPIRFHGVRATEVSDSITHWSAKRQMAPNSITRSAWRTDTLHAPAGQSSTNLDLGDIPVLENHDGAGAHRYATGDAAHQLAEALLLAHESRIKRYQGQGSVRVLAAGQRFKLSQHDRYGVDGDQQEFTCLAVRHEAANNLGTQAADILEATDIEKGSYRNTFEAHPGEAKIAPVLIQKPTAPESMIAIVVGGSDDDPNTAVHTQRDHRVQVRFAWQAQRQSEADYLRQYNRQGTLVQAGRHVSTAASVWVQVATSLAGPNWGHHHLPRKGTEVLLVFIEGDIDRPVIAHQLFNAQDLPPWSAGVDSSANHPGVLSGWHSRSLDGSGFNQWMTDDAPGQVRTRLASSNAASQLNLGHLNAQAPESASRGTWRGTGAELRSDAWVAVRAGEGFLISTVAQNRGQGTTQDTTSARGQLEAGKQAAERLSDAASGAEALALKANDRLQPLLDDLDPEKNGHYPDTVNGQSAKSPDGGGVDSREDKHPVPAFARPLMVLDANTSLNLATPASSIIYAGDAIHWTSQQQAHLAAGKTVSLAAAKSVGLFAAEGGIQVIAQDGPVSIQAHTDELEWLSKEGFTVTSSTDEIHVLAKEKITLKGGQTSITLDGANIILKMPGLLDVKGTSKAFVGPDKSYTTLQKLPGNLSEASYEESFRFLNSTSGRPEKGVRYFIELDDGDFMHGFTDENGMTDKIASEKKLNARVFWSIEALRRVRKISGG